jgi:hypothetical protein
MIVVEQLLARLRHAPVTAYYPLAVREPGKSR